MGVFGGPEIPNDGLVLALDAANNKSILSAVEVLVVAGGGGGGNHHGGGGGAGGLIYNSNFAVTPGTQLTVTVGDGGAARSYGGGNGGNGGNSVFGALTAIGGGGGGSYPNNGSGGGSGGGSTNWSVGTTGGTGTSGQGFAGGSNNGQTNFGGGGGGAGGTAKGLSNNSGGDGLAYNISGNQTYYSGGGGSGVYPGAANDTSYGFGGLGGGGNGGNGPHGSGTAPTAGGTNTGGGGGGVADLYQNSAIGGSGIIIVRYPGPQKAIGGTVTSVGGDTIHTFTTSGTFTPTWGDMSGNGNTGTFTTGVTYSSANGGSLSFDGGDTSHIQIVNTAGQLDFPGDFTVGLWIYPTQYHRTYQTMIDTYPGGATNGWIFTTMYSSSQVISWYTEGSSWQPSGTAVTLNDWNYVVASRIGTTVKLYKNATEIHSHSDSSNIRGGVCRIGRGLDDANNYGNVFGRISNVQIYKGKGLTQAEISQNFIATRSRYGI